MFHLDAGSTHCPLFSNNRVFQDCEKQVWSSIKNKVSANVEEEKTQHAEVLKKVEELTAESFKLLKEKSILQYQESELCLEVRNMKRDGHTASQDIIQLKEVQCLHRRDINVPEQFLEVVVACIGSSAFCLKS